MTKIIYIATTRSVLQNKQFEFSTEIGFLDKSKGLPREIKLLQDYDLFIGENSIIIGLFANADDLPGFGICRHPESTFLVIFVCELTFSSFNIDEIHPLIKKWWSLPKVSWIERLKSRFNSKRDKWEILERLVENGDFTEEEAVLIEKAPINFSTFLPGDVLIVFPYNQYNKDIYDLEDCLWKAGIIKAFRKHIQFYRASFDAEWFERVYKILIRA
jgi:hypothetical protein